jgi:hypothetical protein
MKSGDLAFRDELTGNIRCPAIRIPLEHQGVFPQTRSHDAGDTFPREQTPLRRAWSS